MTNKKTNYARQWYNDYIYQQTKKYQKIYNFKIGEGKHDAWNNEADAFKHTFMSADMALKSTVGISKYEGDKHEIEGRYNMGQSAGEENMDRWNNAEGRKIAQKIAREIKNPFVLKAYVISGKLEDRIAREVYEKMKKGDLITDVNDSRRYQETPKKDKSSMQNKINDGIREQYKRLQEKSDKYLHQIFHSSKSNKTSNSASGQGHWVTINGHHVLIS